MAFGMVTILPSSAWETVNALLKRDWNKPMLSDLAKDIGIVLDGLMQPDRKEFIKEFKKKYQHALEPVDFSKSGVPELMRPLKSVLEQRVALMQATRTATFEGAGTNAGAAAASLSEVDIPRFTGPGFDRERTQVAFALLFGKFEEKWGTIFKEERAAAGEAAEADVLPKGQLARTGKPLTQSEQRQWANVEDKARAEMGGPNALFKAHLEQSNIRVAMNNGDRLNCLIISLLQHATGNYDDPSPAAAAKYRAMIDHDDMLFSDDGDFAEIVAAINKDYNVDMNVLCVRADEEGVPFFEGDFQTGKDNVVIWNQGMHYEALVSKT